MCWHSYVLVIGCQQSSSPFRLQKHEEQLALRHSEQCEALEQDLAKVCSSKQQSCFVHVSSVRTWFDLKKYIYTPLIYYLGTPTIRRNGPSRIVAAAAGEWCLKSHRIQWLTCLHIHATTFSPPSLPSHNPYEQLRIIHLSMAWIAINWNLDEF